MALFTVENLTFSYPGQTARAIDSLSLTVPEGAFLVLCGPSGCGKSTLLRQLKPALAPHGTRQGRILFRDTPLDRVDHRTLAARIGFVQQSPENQIVTDKVWHELAFGLESLGVDTPTIRRRVAEMAAFFGIEDWFYRDVSQLSGGQKQLLNLASVMAMQPDVLILDEPTSQLDPIAASDFLAVLGKINRELGVTILLITHQMQVVQRICNKVAVMENGRIVEQGTVLDVFGSPKQEITRSFVRAIIQDEVPQSIQKIVKADGKGGKIEKLKFVGNTVNEPVIAEICQQSGVEVNILCASVQEMQDSVMCVFLLRLLGEESAIAAAEAFIDKTGVLREEVVLK